MQSCSTPLAAGPRAISCFAVQTLMLQLTAEEDTTPATLRMQNLPPTGLGYCKGRRCHNKYGAREGKGSTTQTLLLCASQITANNNTRRIDGCTTVGVRQGTEAVAHQSGARSSPPPPPPSCAPPPAGTCRLCRRFFRWWLSSSSPSPAPASGSGSPSSHPNPGLLASPLAAEAGAPAPARAASNVGSGSQDPSPAWLLAPAKACKVVLGAGAGGPTGGLASLALISNRKSPAAAMYRNADVSATSCTVHRSTLAAGKLNAD